MTFQLLYVATAVDIMEGMALVTKFIVSAYKRYKNDVELAIHFKRSGMLTILAISPTRQSALIIKMIEHMHV